MAVLVQQKTLKSLIARQLTTRLSPGMDRGYAEVKGKSLRQFKLDLADLEADETNWDQKFTFVGSPDPVLLSSQLFTGFVDAFLSSSLADKLLSLSFQGFKFYYVSNSLQLLFQKVNTNLKTFSMARCRWETPEFIHLFKNLRACNLSGFEFHPSIYDYHDRRTWWRLAGALAKNSSLLDVDFTMPGYPDGTPSMDDAFLKALSNSTSFLISLRLEIINIDYFAVGCYSLGVLLRTSRLLKSFHLMEQFDPQQTRAGIRRIHIWILKKSLERSRSLETLEIKISALDALSIMFQMQSLKCLTGRWYKAWGAYKNDLESLAAKRFANKNHLISVRDYFFLKSFNVFI